MRITGNNADANYDEIIELHCNNVFLRGARQKSAYTSSPAIETAQPSSRDRILGQAALLAMPSVQPFKRRCYCVIQFEPL